MKYIFLTAAVFICCKNLQAQNPYNKPDHCTKTTWSEGGHQVTTYNINNDLIALVQVNEHGDTAQIMRYKYDEKGRETWHMNKIGRSVKSESTTMYTGDSATVIYIHDEGEPSTRKYKTGVRGKPIYTSSEECICTYDKDSNIITSVCTDRITKEKDSIVNVYDKHKNVIRQTGYHQGSWNWTSKKKYNGKNQEIKEVYTDVYKNKRVNHSEYDSEGRLIREHGLAWGERSEMRYEYFNCK